MSLKEPKTPSHILGPVFEPMPCQSHPARKVLDLGIQMKWGQPTHTNRIYRNIRDHAPAAFRFEDALVHEEDIVCGVDYQPTQFRKTPVGTFVSLSAVIAALYENKLVDRSIFEVLADVDRVFPPDQPVVGASNGGEDADLSMQDFVPRTGMLAEELEAKGFRVTGILKRKDRMLLCICWLTRPGGRLIFAGVIEIRPTEDGIKSQWMLPGPCGVPRLLRPEFEHLCEGLACLSSKGIKQCLEGVTPNPQTRKPAKHISSTTNPPHPPAPANPVKLTSSPSLPRNKPN